MLSGCAAVGNLGRAFEPNIYTVRSGDTLYAIAWRYGLDVNNLIQWNDIAEPGQLRPGQRIRLAPADGGPGTTGAQRTESQGSGSSQDGRVTASAPQNGAAEGSVQESSTESAEASSEQPAADGDAPDAWRWPTDGELVGTFGNGRVFGQGLDIAGEAGQPIRATAAGEIVYSGDGLQAYGPLIIIRHSAEYLSAYAHNRDVRVSEGDRVEQGERIASMGRPPDEDALLHFEIRRNGEPVDPLDFLDDRR